MHKPFAYTLIATAAFLASAAMAQTAPAAAAAPKAPEPDLSVSYNVSVINDYRYRGISQTRLAPALQGGADLSHKNGFYLGTWASTSKWNSDAGKLYSPAVDTGNNKLEIDLYGGYKGEIAKDVAFDVGALQYLFPGNKYDALGGGAVKTETLEVYAAVTSGPLTLKYSQALSNTFGFASTTANSKGSGYLELNTSFELSKGLTLTAHLGRQVIANFKSYSYSDYNVLLNKEFDGGWVLSGGAVGTNARKDVSGNVGNLAYASPEGKNLGKGGALVSVKKTF